uniref:Uncharacterized protein n=1 Tax=Octopus bimaculoides TaxID=37653 RepID=A0A0L8IH49_OCTBM
MILISVAMIIPSRGKTGVLPQAAPNTTIPKPLIDRVELNGVESFSIQPRQLETAPTNRITWRSTTYTAVAAFEEDRWQRLAARDAASSSVPATEYKCLTCTCPCASGFGRRSHIRSHR